MGAGVRLEPDIASFFGAIPEIGRMPHRLGGKVADQAPAPARRAAGSRLTEF
jgi:hypothetical protein